VIEFVVTLTKNNEEGPELVRFRPSTVRGPNAWFGQVDTINLGLDPMRSLYIEHPFYHEEDAYEFATARAEERFNAAKARLAEHIDRIRGNLDHLLSSPMAITSGERGLFRHSRHTAPGDIRRDTRNETMEPSVDTYYFETTVSRYTILGFDQSANGAWLVWGKVEDKQHGGVFRVTWSVEKWKRLAGGEP